MTTPYEAPLNYRTPSHEISTVSSRAKFTAIFIYSQIVLTVLTIPAMFAIPLLMPDGTTAPVAGSGTLIAVGGAMCCIGFLSFGVAIAMIVFFCMWVFASNNVARTTGAANMKYTPGWAVGWFFIPIANIVMSYKVMSEIWRASDPAVSAGAEWQFSPSTPLLPLWWTAWLASGFFNVAGSIVGKIGELGGGDLLPYLWGSAILQFLGLLASLVALIMLLLLIRRITERLSLRVSQIQTA